MKYKYILMGLMTSMLMIFGGNEALSQQKGKKATPIIEVSTQITDSEGNPLKNASVLSNGGAVVTYSDADGNVTLRTKTDGVLLIEYPGYQDVVVDLRETLCPLVIELVENKLHVSDGDIITRGDGFKQYKAEGTSSISDVDIEDVSRMPELQMSNTLQGQGAGLIAVPGTGGVGYDNASLYIRGQHTMGTNSAIVLIDDMERPIDDILPDEIESIKILKDASAQILYGPRAANGVILITTKRGEMHKRTIDVNLEYGIQPTTRLPQYLSAYDYAVLFNEACANDGIAPYYSDADLEGYKQSTGPFDLYYPDADYYSDFLLSQKTYRKASLKLNGGNKNALYAVTVGYTGSSGLEKIGDRSDLNRLNARGNLDIIINDFLSVSADVAARVEMKGWGAVDGGTLFSEISTLRPNEYPWMIKPEDINGKNGITVEDDALVFGTSTRKSNNIYSDMMYGGNTSERYVSSQTNLGLNFDFDEYVKGLKADAYVTFDNYSYLRQKLTNSYPTYSMERYYDDAGELVWRFTEKKQLNLPKKQSVNAEETYRSLGFRANVGYDRVFGDHAIGGYAAFRFFQKEQVGSNQDIKNINASLRMNYSYANKYLAEVSVAEMGSNRFQKGKLFLSYAASAGWVISNEDFMSDLDGIDYLKLKASYGVVGYDGNMDYFLYRTNWSKGDKHEFKPSTGGNVTNYNRLGNPDLKWESSHMLNIGVEAAFLNNRLFAEVEYFRENRKNIIGANNTDYSSIVGDFKPYDNIGSVVNQGFDGFITWKDRLSNDFTYEVGLNLTYSKNTITETSEVFDEAYRKAVGHSTSTIFGLNAEGLFGKDVDMNGHPRQTFSEYTVGDIAYQDLNGDGVVDDNDLNSIGQSFPVTTMGLSIDLNYKGIGLYVLGTATTGVTKMGTSSYYWNNGLDGYSVLANDRYHPVNNPEGTQPRLTTTTASNNFRNSSFWAMNGNFFRLKNVELSYSLQNKSGKGFGKKYKIFVRGTNLFVLSGIKDLDPERILSGVSNYPAYRTFTGGVTLTF